jgi:chromosome segregation ATPase
LEKEQINKRVSWLDEQRRKDAEEVTRLEELLEELDESSKQHSQQLRDLAGDVARIPALEARIRQYDETIAKHRSEILQQLDTQDERRIAREKQLESLRTIDQKKVVDEIDELRNRLKELDQINESLETRRREELRVSRAVDEIDTKVNQATTAIENEKRSISGIREGREKNSQRINELESRGSSASKRVAELQSLFDSSEDQLRKLTIRAEMLEVNEKELRQSQALWTEQQAARLAEFERAWNGWEKRFAEFEIQSDDLKDRIDAYEETHRGLRLLRDELQAVVERLDRRTEEVSEIQRLSEDRFKHDWSTFQADEQKRWSSFKLSSEEQWKEHDRKHKPISEQLKELQARLETTILSFEDFDRSSKGRISDLVALVQEWGAELRDGDG